MRRRFTIPSERQRKEKVNAAFDFLGMPQFKTELKPKRIRRPVDGKPQQATEHQEQATVISWWWTQHGRYRIPVFALFAIPNGGARDSITGAMLKAEGVRPGTPDLMLAVPTPSFSGLFIEMKKIDGREPTDDQVAFRDYLLSVGYSASVHYGATSAIKGIEDYLSEFPLLGDQANALLA